MYILRIITVTESGLFATKLMKFYMSHKIIKSMKKNSFFIYLFFTFIILQLLPAASFSQNAGVGINSKGSSPNSKALLDIDATGMNPKAGLLIPRMNTNDRNAITAPIPESLLIYNTDSHCYEAYFNNSWVSFSCLGGCQVPAQPSAGINTPSSTQIIWNWSTVSGATGYKWGTSNVYGSATDNGTIASYTQTGLTCNTAYTIYVWAYNSCGNSIATTLTQTSASCCSVNCSGIGNIGTIAGTGIAGFTGDGGQSVCSKLNNPAGVAVDASGNLYIADDGNSAIRKVTVSTGIISTLAGNGTAGSTGDGGASTSAKLSYPFGVCLDASGNVYIADNGNSRIRKITVSTGIITTVAGNGVAGFSGDGNAATIAQLRQPSGVAVDASGNIYIADWGNSRIRKVTLSTGKISTIAGNGTNGYNGDGIAATSSELNGSTGIIGVAVDGAGNVYIGDATNNRVRKVTVSSGIISTIAGNGTGGYAGDGTAANSAELNLPAGVAFDVSGNMYIAEQYNNRIRKVLLSSGIINTIAGNGTAGYTGDGGAATNASLHSPSGVAVDNAGNVFIADDLNNRVRELCK